MPQPNHPPYNIVQPRQLNRWLDVNAQNGPLTRSRYYLVVPSYNLNYISPSLVIQDIGVVDAINAPNVNGILCRPLVPGWLYLFSQGNATILFGALGGGVQPLITIESNQTEIFEAIEPIDNTGVSYLGTDSLITYPTGFVGIVGADLKQALPVIIGQYDYIAPAPFSLSKFILTKNPNVGTIIINSQLSGRYILNDDPFNPIFGSTPYYKNQKIDSKFRIEIWASSGNVSSGILNLSTSILTKLDYRYDDDTPIFPTDFITQFPGIFPIVNPIIPQNVIADPNGNLLADPDGNLIQAL